MVTRYNAGMDDHTNLTPHPAADVFPMMTDDELAVLAADIKTNGLRLPIVVSGDVLLDGRNRIAACDLAGVKARRTQFKGGNPVAFIVSSNLHRRHLNATQRGVVADSLATLSQGRPQKETPPRVSLTRPEAADTLNVGTTTVERVAAVRTAAEDGDERAAADYEAMKAGTKGAKTAANAVQKRVAEEQAERLRASVPGWSQDEERLKAIGVWHKSMSKLLHQVMDTDDDVLTYMIDYMENDERDSNLGILDTIDDWTKKVRQALTRRRMKVVK